MDEAAEVALRVAAAHLAREDTRVEEVLFVLFDKSTYESYARVLKQLQY